MMKTVDIVLSPIDSDVVKKLIPARNTSTRGYKPPFKTKKAHKMRGAWDFSCTNLSMKQATRLILASMETCKFVLTREVFGRPWETTESDYNISELGVPFGTKVAMSAATYSNNQKLALCDIPSAEATSHSEKRRF
ncbi:hypothetical protein GQ607_017525 [Colletotrichum asianum]|uniref:Uncharacterized protein n=1 Tax=Colletotrichum asianum TaxID=702518 RepID=A0A8H3VYX4_9PEZI|nr:hypothetical protein GQ607_017525 [Colletotrichum asianum]